LFTRSQRTFPEQTTIRSTALGSRSGSVRTGSQRPEVNSEGCETASRLRSIDFGVITISGRCRSPSACWRSRWKWLAGVDGWATMNESSAASCSHRSIRAELWSGP
jgi:hypothetical protein